MVYFIGDGDGDSLYLKRGSTLKLTMADIQEIEFTVSPLGSTYFVSLFDPLGLHQKQTLRRTTQEQMEAMVASYQSSGLTQREFCHRENIKLPPFSYWYRKVCTKTESLTSGFTEVTAPVQSGGLEVVFPNGVTIRGIQDLSLIRQLVKW